MVKVEEDVDGNGDESGYEADLVTNTSTRGAITRRLSDMSHPTQRSNGHPEPEVIVNVGDIALYS
jgi:hypothetical protein